MDNPLLLYYKDMNLLSDWYKQHSSSAQNVILYAFKGTNGRSLASIIDAFKKMEEVEGLDRKEWPLKQKTGQEQHKQYPARMLETKLYYRNANGRFYKTEKGKIYKDFVSRDFNEKSQWAINYIFLLDSYFEETELYLTNRSKEIFDLISKAVPSSFIKDAIRDFNSKHDRIKSFADLVTQDLFFLLSFYDDSNFLKKFHEAGAASKNELRNYILSNYDDKEYHHCCLSQKFKPGGTYNIKEFKDDVRIFSVSLDIYSNSSFGSFQFTLAYILSIIKRYLDFPVSEVSSYLIDKKDIIEPILLNVYKVAENEEAEGEEKDPHRKTVDYNEIDKPERKIDDTSSSGRKQLSSIFQHRKGIARRMSGFTCELEGYKDCRYFTSKNTGHNYVEVHHFIPREFRNNYEYSIDVFANYVTLCPHCHKMIHLATDRERMDAIRYIYNNRIERLRMCGLDTKFDIIMKYYHIVKR